jgi:hypothetical protein
MEKLSYLLNKSFNYYDSKKNEYKNFINDEVVLDPKNSNIKFKKNNKFFKYEMLGLFDNNTNVWVWSWMIPSIDMKKKIISKKLLDYGLKLNVFGDDFDQLYLRTQLVNSRFLLNNSIQLEIHVALSSYLAKNNFLFIFPMIQYINKEKTKYFTLYLCILEKENKANKIYEINNDKINLTNFINNAISFYDKNNDKFKKYINDKNHILDIEEGKIIFNDTDKKFNYELLGIFDKINLIWIWSWMIPSVSSEKTLLAKKILNFGLNLNVFIEDNEKLYLKTQFVNSRFYINDNFQLKMNIVLSSFVIKNDFLFIYPIKNKSKNFNILKFLLIKDN